MKRSTMPPSRPTLGKDNQLQAPHMEVLDALLSILGVETVTIDDDKLAALDATILAGTSPEANSTPEGWAAFNEYRAAYLAASAYPDLVTLEGLLGPDGLVVKGARTLSLIESGELKLKDKGSNTK